MGTEQEAVEQAVEKTIEVKSDSIRQEYAFASDIKLKECKYCRVMIPKKARICPNCKMILKNHIFIKMAATLVVIALIGGGCYCLSAYWGILPDSMVPVWIAQQEPAEPVLEATTVETPEIAAEAKTVEPAEVVAGAKTVEPAEAAAEAKTVEPAEVAAGAKTLESAEAVDGAGTIESAWVPTVAEEQEAKETNNSGDETVKPAENKTNTTDKKEAEGKDETKEDISASDSVDEDKEETKIPADADKEETAFRTDCERVGYKSLLREQQDHLDEAIMLEAEVICMVDGGLFDENTYYLCMAEEKNSIERYYIIRDDRKTDETFILEGDFLTIYGQLFGNCKVPANLIETRPTVPAVSMLYCDLAEE